MHGPLNTFLLRERHQSKRYCAGSEYRKSPLWCLFFIKRLDKRIIVWYTDSVMRKIIGNIIGFGIVLYLLVYISIPILTILFT